MSTNRTALLREAMQAATDTRDRLDLDEFDPVDPFDIAAKLGIKVVLLAASGFYFKGSKPRILLSSARPLPRRAFTCAHEVGHHVFGHGSTIDELHEDDRPDSDKPEEILANGFASFLLMPSVGLRGAFARRGWSIAEAKPLQLFTVACQFGVGYRTLISHLSFTLREIAPVKRKELERWTPQRIRRDSVGEDCEALLIVDAKNEATTFDVEKAAGVLLPAETEVAGVALQYQRSIGQQKFYVASRRGIATVTGLKKPFDVRVMPKPYEGAAVNRFLEDPDED